MGKRFGNIMKWMAEVASNKNNKLELTGQLLSPIPIVQDEPSWIY